MTDLDDKVKKTCEDVEKLKSQIGNILQTLIANKDLVSSIMSQQCTLLNY